MRKILSHIEIFLKGPIAVFTLIFFIAFSAFTQERVVFDHSKDLIPSAITTQHQEAKRALKAEKRSDAYVIWKNLAVTYESQNRLQEAAWTYLQINELNDYERVIAKITDLLKSGRIVDAKKLKSGITEPYRIFLDNGLSAVFKNDGANKEVAAFRLDHFLKLGLTPTTIPYVFDGEHGSLQLWIDQSKPAWEFPEFKKGMAGSTLTSSDLIFFDHLIWNSDRHYGNYLVREGNYFVAIDHGTSMGKYEKLDERVERAIPIPRGSVYQRLQEMDDETVKSLLGDLLTSKELLFFKKKKELLMKEIETALALKGPQIFSGTDPYLSSLTEEELQKLIKDLPTEKASEKALEKPMKKLSWWRACAAALQSH